MDEGEGGEPGQQQRADREREVPAEPGDQERPHAPVERADPHRRRADRTGAGLRQPDRDQHGDQQLYRGVWYYTIGEILIRANAGRRAEGDRPRYRDTVFANLDASRYPNLAVLGRAGRA